MEKFNHEQASLDEMARVLGSAEFSAALKTEQLSLLSSLLAVDSSARATRVLEAVSLPVLFGCLHSNDVTQVRACCSVLKKLINTLESDALRADGLLQSGFEHTNAEVRLLCMSAASKSLSSEAACLAFLESDTSRSAVKLLADEDLLCSQAAAEFLSSATDRVACARFIFNADGVLLAELLRLLAASSTVRYRVLTLVASLCVKSGEMLSLCHRAALLRPLFEDLSTEDILVRLNALEVLGTLATAPHTVEHLISAGVVDRIADVIRTADSDPLNQFILPGVYKFYGLLCDGGLGSVSEFHQQHPVFLDSALAMLAEQGSALFLTLVDTIALACRGNGGATKLVLRHPAAPKAFESLCRVVAIGPSDARLRALLAMRVILTAALLPDAGLTADDMACAERRWYDPMASSSSRSATPASTVWSCAKDPSSEVRSAAFHLLAVFTRLPFGARDLARLPGFLEHVLDRATETERSGWEAKYALAQDMAASSLMKEHLDSAEVLQLRTYLRQGVIYVQGQTAAAVDDDYI